MFAHERHQAILEALAKSSPLAIGDLQRKLDVSAPTIRRDLAFLSKLGKIVRTHGGVMHPDQIDGEFSFDRKSRAALDAKLALARVAADLMVPGQTAFVDAGSTTFEIGRRLLQSPGLTVFTNSVPLLSVRPAAGARLVAVGGEVRSLSLALVGSEVFDWLGKVRIDLAFLGTSGLDRAAGATTTEFSEAGVKSAVAGKARRTVVVADASKWDQPAPICFAPWHQISDLVCDHSFTRAELAELTARGTRLHRPHL